MRHKNPYLKFLIAVLFFLYGCNPQPIITELSNDTVTFDETIRINNCGNKANSTQTASRSFATKIEGTGSIKAGYEKIIEAGVSATYEQYRNTTKTQELTAAPDTNMEFVLRWSDDVRAGNATINGENTSYTIRIPVSVAQLSSKDLGCDETSTNSTETSVEISAYCAVFDKSPSYATVGQEIVLRWGWEAKTKAEVQEYLDTATLLLEVDGEKIDTSFATIILETTETGNYAAHWLMPARIFSEGTHQVTLTQILDHQVTDGLDNDNDGKIDTFGPGTITSPPCEIIVK